MKFNKLPMFVAAAILAPSLALAGHPHKSSSTSGDHTISIKNECGKAVTFRLNARDGKSDHNIYTLKNGATFIHKVGMGRQFRITSNALSTPFNSPRDRVSAGDNSLRFVHQGSGCVLLNGY